MEAKLKEKNEEKLFVYFYRSGMYHAVCKTSHLTGATCRFGKYGRLINSDEETQGD